MTSLFAQSADKLRSDVDCLTSQRSTLEDTVTSLMKEKDMLLSSAAGLEDKVQIAKKVGKTLSLDCGCSSINYFSVDARCHTITLSMCPLWVAYHGLRLNAGQWTCGHRCFSIIVKYQSWIIEHCWWAYKLLELLVDLEFSVMLLGLHKRATLTGCSLRSHGPRVWE